MDLVKNHAILTASLSDSSEHSALAKDDYIIATGFPRLKFGWNIVVLLNWVSAKTEYVSTDVCEQLIRLKEGAPRKGIVQSLLKYANQDIVPSHDGSYGIYGCNIVAPRGTQFSSQDINTVLDLIQGTELTLYLHKQIPDRLGGNILTTKKLNKLISLIDFPIPSISCLLQTLKYTFLVENPYLSEGIVIGKTAFTGYFSVMYDNHYKIMQEATLAALASEGLLKQPLTTLQCLQLSVETNHFRE